ncbi:conserved hypothetical protein [Herminiimonas arsenicoxydans]|uniref:DUF2971 domain-containing protein n=1 Tax=Herminiimonas arsenicoxydans TaxID=204773 RepID=A4G1E6_HERAR|nr:conserved hypothetical protein [Herminiimonas arsenicoxydans]
MKNTAQEIHDMFQALFSDLIGEDTFPEKRPLLAHYTSISTLECIMKNDEIWLGNPLLMNDRQELRFGIIEAAKSFRLHDGIKEACGGDDRYKNLLSTFERKLEITSNEDSFDTYVMCFSEHSKDNKKSDGLLSMWRGYGANGNGAAIVFDTGKINPSETSPLILSDVTYASTEDRLTWIDEKLDEFALLLKTSEISEDMFYVPIHLLIERFKLFALFTKHDGFEEEKEWRLVYLKDRDRDGKLSDMLDYFLGSNGIEPKLKLKIRPIDGVIEGSISLENIVKEIILGPSISNILTLMTVKRMLTKVSKPELANRVVMSSTPFRATT